MTPRAKDLMIGDWVFFPEINRYGVVETIYGNGNIIVKDQVTPYIANRYMRKCDIFEPIPLTQEILEKNGWSEDYDEETDSVSHHFPEDTDFKLEIYVEGKMILWTINCYEYEIIRLSYVHELQHALKLCGIEKEIEL